MQFIGKIDAVPQLMEYQHANAVFCEKLLTYWYAKILNPGDTCLDVGARVGHHFVPMARKVGQTGQALGIEANSEVAGELRERVQNIEGLPNDMEIVSVAASSQSGEASFFIREDFQGWSSMYETHVHPSEVKDAKVESVKTETLDKIFGDLGWSKCDFIKLDIEHSEFPALVGAKGILKSMEPVVVFENSPRVASRLNDYSIEEFVEYFENIDYELYDIFFNKVTVERLKTDAVLPSYYLCYPRSKEDQISGLKADYNNHCISLIEGMDIAA